MQPLLPLHDVAKKFFSYRNWIKLFYGTRSSNVEKALYWI